MVISIPSIVAHRGLHSRQPENSLSAMEAAWEGGVDWCECDIQLSSDGQFVVLHDDKLDRTTTGQGVMSNFTWEELQKLWLRGAGKKSTGEKLPLLQQLLDAMPQHAGLLIEIKPVLTREPMKRVLELVKGRRCMLQSFARENLVLLEAIGVDFPTAWLVDDAFSAVTDGNLVPVPCTAVYTGHKNLNSILVQHIRGNGRAVGCWTVNTDADIRRVVGLGVDTIITDQPARVMRIAPPRGARQAGQNR